MGPKDREPRGERSEVTWSTDVKVFRRVIAADDAAVDPSERRSVWAAGSDEEVLN